MTTNAPTIIAIRGLQELKRGWDGREAAPMDPEAIASALDFCRYHDFPTQPKVVPINGGKLQLEWSEITRQRSLEIEFDGKTLHYLMYDPPSHIRSEKIVPTTILLQKQIDWFHKVTQDEPVIGIFMSDEGITIDLPDGIYLGPVNRDSLTTKERRRVATFFFELRRFGYKVEYDDQDVTRPTRSGDTKEPVS